MYKYMNAILLWLQICDTGSGSGNVTREWKAGHALRRQPKYRRALRFINNSPSFFSQTSPSSYLYSGWGGCVRSEMAKAVEASLGQLNNRNGRGNGHGHGHGSGSGSGRGRGEREVTGAIKRRHGGDPDDVDIDFDFDFDAIGTHSSSQYQGEAQLREVISALDEKLRDLKKKYAEEMRRSLHIQIMKAESEKLDLVEHFSRLLEEKDIELGFLQKSARGDDSREHESYFGSVSHTRPPSLNKDFFKKGILEKEEHSGPQITPKGDHTLPTISTANVAPNEPSFTALGSLPHSARSSVSSVADLMRFEAALEQILPDLGPDEAQPVVGELDKELFERFVMRDDTSSGASSPNKTPRSPTREVEGTPRSTPQTPRSAAQTPRSAAQTPRSAVQTPRSAVQTPRSASQSPQKSAKQTPRSASHKPSTSGAVDNEELNEDSDFDEFAEFAEYQDYEVEDAIEASEEGYYSNRSRASTHRTQNGGRLSTARAASTSASASAYATSTSATLPTNDAYRGTTSPKRVYKSHSSTSVSSVSDEDSYPVQKQPSTRGQTRQSDTSNQKSHRSDLSGGRFAIEMDRYMDMDLQDLMTLVNEKYRADDSDPDDIDPVDIEALKKQYGFDD